MIEYFAQLDARIFFVVNRIENPVLTFIGNTVATEKGLIVIIALLALLFFWKNKKELAGFFFSYVAVAAVITGSKYLFARARPIETLDVINKLTQYPGSPSFPSFVAGSIGVLAYLFAARFPNYRILVFVLGFAASFIRVYTGAHYPSDVMAGYLLGFFLPLAVMKLDIWRMVK